MPPYLDLLRVEPVGASLCSIDTRAAFGAHPRRWQAHFPVARQAPSAVARDHRGVRRRLLDT